MIKAIVSDTVEFCDLQSAIDGEPVAGIVGRAGAPINTTVAGVDEVSGGVKNQIPAIGVRGAVVRSAAPGCTKRTRVGQMHPLTPRGPRSVAPEQPTAVIIGPNAIRERTLVIETQGLAVTSDVDRILVHRISY